MLVQKIVFPIVNGLLPFGFSGGAYAIATRRWKQKESLRDRSFLFYRALSGVLLGISIGSVWAPSALFFCFVIGGYLLVDAFESIARVWKDGYYVVPAPGTEDLAFDPETGQKKKRLKVNNVFDERLPEVMFTQEDMGKDTQMRKVLLACLFVLLCIFALLTGLRVVILGPALNAGSSACYLILNASMTVALIGGMLHAHIHVQEELKRARFWWIITTVGWSVSLVCTTIPFLLDVSPLVGAQIVSHIGFSVVYGVCTGAALHMQQYYYNMKLSQIDRRETLFAILVFVAMAGGVTVASYFFQ